MSYVTLTEFKAEGATGENDRLTAALALAKAYIDRVTGQWFEPSESKTLYFDGDGENILHLPVPAITVTKITTDDDREMEVDEDDFTLYAGSGPPDHRRNPKIRFYSGMPVGKLNIAVTGTWGFVEDDGSTPLLIKKACILLALTEVDTLDSDSRRDPITRGRVIEEETDRHSYKLGELAASGGPTGEPEIDVILASYRRPLAMAVI